MFDKRPGRHQPECRELLRVVIDLCASTTTLAVPEVLESKSRQTQIQRRYVEVIQRNESAKRSLLFIGGVSTKEDERIDHKVNLFCLQIH